MKKKNGFTLVELLVVITLMLSILGIVIVSTVTISNKKKQDAWKQVKSQIETAAKEYFFANEYLFEGLNNSVTGEISVGKLIEEDYLNKVTNPIDGKAISKCSMVVVTKNGKKYSTAFDDSTKDSNASNCESDNSITIKEAGAPEFDIVKTCENKSGKAISEQNGFCYAATFNLENVKAGGQIISKKFCIGTGTCSLNNDINNINDSISGTSSTTDNGVIGVSLTNQSGATQVKYIIYKIDRDKPTGTVMLSRNNGQNYNSNTPKLSINVKDDHSGLATASFSNAKNPSTDDNSWNLKGNNWTPVFENFEIYKGPGFTNQYSLNGETINEGSVPLTVTDKVGNVGIIQNNDYTTYKKCSETVKSTAKGTYGSCSKACGGGTKTRTDTTNIKDKYISSISCPGDGATNITSVKCNTMECCSKTKESGNTNWGDWTNTCDNKDKQTRTGTKKLVSAYDSKISCGTTAKSETKNCDLTPSIDKVQFRYNRSKCPNGWVEIRYYGINMAKYTATFRYSHTVQGTTATTSTEDNSNSLNETFCRGYGSSSSNVMSFEVTLKNNANNRTRKYSGKCKYSEMFDGNKYNTSWHDCSMD